VKGAGNSKMKQNRRRRGMVEHLEQLIKFGEYSRFGKDASDYFEQYSEQ